MNHIEIPNPSPEEFSTSYFEAMVQAVPLGERDNFKNYAFSVSQEIMNHYKERISHRMGSLKRVTMDMFAAQKEMSYGGAVVKVNPDQPEDKIILFGPETTVTMDVGGLL